MSEAKKSLLPLPSKPEIRDIDPMQFIAYFMNKPVNVEYKNATVMGTIIQFGGGMMTIEKLDRTRKLFFMAHVVSIEEIRPQNVKVQ